MVVTVSPDGQLTSPATTLTFTPSNWNSAQTVSVNAVDDAIAEGTHLAFITLTSESLDFNYDNLPAVDLAVTVSDNDRAGVVLVQSDAGTEVAEGGAADSYTVALATQPAADVTVSLVFSDQLNVSPTILTFTPADWNAPQTVDVSAINDAIDEGTRVATISHTVASSDAQYHNLPVVSVDVIVTDNDASPEAGFDVFGVAEDSVATALAVLANDSGNGLTISAVAQGPLGEVIITGGGTGLTYEPSSGFSGTDLFTYTVTDVNGVTATAGVLINVLPQNDSPVLTTPGAQSIRANTKTTINGILVSDPDALQGNGLVEVTMSVQEGELTLATVAGLNFSIGDGSGDGTMRFQGLLPNVAAALSGLSYLPRADSLAPDSLSIVVSDLGNSGAGGALTASGSVALKPVTNQLEIQSISAKVRDLVIYGTLDADSIVIKGGGTTFKVSMDGGSTFQTVKKINGRVLAFGLNGDDKLDATKMGRVVVLGGGSGNDTLFGGSKNDRLSGGADQDSLDGGKGVDRLVEAANGDFTLSPTSLSGALGNDGLVNIEEADLSGGDGDNTLNAGAFLGKATLNGGAGNDSLTGAQGGGLIMGGAGNDLMTGGAGRDVMIGGGGLDALTGGGGDDLLIGGTTIHDGNKAALEGIIAEWQHKSRKYADRIARLTGLKPNGLNNSFLLNTTTVSHDDLSNVLTGGGDLDWFFANVLDTTDAASGETTTGV